MSNQQYITVAADLYWAKLDKVDDLSQKYGVTLANLSEAATEALSTAGINVKFREDKPELGCHIKSSSKYEIKAFYKDGTEVRDRVGNGSKAHVKLRIRPWEYMKKKGVSADISKLTITSLVLPDSHEAADDGEVL